MMKETENYIKFLGTAGARFVMIRQLRASAGIWLSWGGTNLLIDPGPGSLVRCANSKPRLDPTKLDGIILTHRHLDHSGDINVMIEAMTEGGFKKKGVIFLPQDAVAIDPIVLKYVQDFVQKIEILKESKDYFIGNIKFSTSPRHIHPVETYGLKFHLDKKTVSLITDTRYFSKIKNIYKADIIIISTVFYEARPEVDHLSLNDAIKIIQDIKPKLAILTHFGMTMLKAKPHLIAQDSTKRLNIEVIAAYDGMKLDLAG